VVANNCSCTDDRMIPNPGVVADCYTVIDDGKLADADIFTEFRCWADDCSIGDSWLRGLGEEPIQDLCKIETRVVGENVRNPKFTAVFRADNYEMLGLRTHVT